MALSKPANAAIELGIVGTVANDSAAILFGTAGDDIISGGSIDIESIATDGIDVMEGGAGNDTYIVRNSTDTVIELIDEGVDTVWSSATFTLAAEVENIGASGTAATTLTGNAKNNILDGSQAAGVNTLVGGTGSDTYYLGAGDLVTEAAGAGTDTVIISDVVAAAVYNLATGLNIGTLASAGAIENVQLSGSAAASITGNALNNRLSGNSGINTIIGGGGNDILDTGTGGADILTGDVGNDTFIIRAGATATIADSAGVDLVKSFVTYNGSAVTTGIENITLMGAAAINATGNDALGNILTGNDAVNILIGNGGNDTLIGNAGNDDLQGGLGNDILNGGVGTNSLQGGTGSDTYIVTSATDTITGELAGAEIDTVQFSGTAAFTLVTNVENITLTNATLATGITTGNASNNVMIGNAFANTLTGLAGNDTLTGNAGVDVLTGGDGNDSLNGGTENDTLNGDAGLDTLTGGTATTFNTLIGGLGNDTYVIVDKDDEITEGSLAADGTDTIQFAGIAAADTFNMNTNGVNVENITLTGALAINVTGNGSANSMTGNAAINTLDGGAGNDTLNGGAGNDALIGGDGNDSLIGGTGIGLLVHDTMTGGAGFDTYSVDSLTDVVNESILDGGTDLVNSTVSFDLGVSANAGVENLVLGGTALIGAGNTLANNISGNASNNTLTGLGGIDTINAGGGNDLITGGTGKDTVTTGTGTDTISFAAGVTDTVATSNSIAGVDLYSDLVLTAATADKIDLSVLVTNAATAISGISLTEATFISNMNSFLSLTGQGFDTNAGGIEAVVITASGGGLAGKSFLAVDLDASDTFTATDFVIEITGGSSFAGMTAASFI